MSRQDCVRRAKEVISSNLADSKMTFSNHLAEVKNKIPGFTEIDNKIKQIGPRIMAATMAHDSGESFENIQKDYNQLVVLKKSLLTSSGFPADYCDMKYHCEKCGDTGYCGIDMCECLKKEIISATLESSGLYSLTKNQTFDTFSLDYYKEKGLNYMKRNLDMLSEFVDSFKPGNSASFLFMGGTGLGKTHLSSAVAKSLIEKGNDVTYVSSIDLFADYESVQFNRQNSEGIELEKYLVTDLLIIDDLGCEMTTNFTLQVIYNVINQRLMTHRSTIISTNLTQDELRKRYSDRVLSRIFGDYKVLAFIGNDIREQKIGK